MSGASIAPRSKTADMERDRFFTPGEARDHGLVDRVIPHRG
jgi:ATP-dependent protease ClpP protease subunit